MDKGFLVFGDIEETLNELSDEQVGQLFRAMVSYHNTGERPVFDDVALKYAFIPIRQQIDRGVEAYKEKCETNRKNALKRVERERSQAMAANAIDGSLTKTETDAAKAAPDADASSLSLSIVSYLNERTGSSWSGTDEATVRLVADLIGAGYTEPQMREVIDKKTADWLGEPKFEQYLRPSTLFKPDNFYKYLNEPAGARLKDQREKEAKDQRRKDAEADVMALSDEWDRLVAQYNTEPDIKRRIDLKGTIAVVEARLQAARAAAGMP